MIETAEAICGKKRVKRNMKRTSWWNEEIENTVKGKKYLRTNRQEDYQDYIIKRNDTKKAIKEAKDKS